MSWQNNISSVYLIGIGGIGMSALARFFLKEGKTVSGYDRTETTLTQKLVSEGATITFSDEIANVNAYDLVIYTPAIPQSNQILTAFKNAGTPLLKRSEVLGKLSADFETIAVAGTHGKTTTSCLLAHLLHQSSQNCTAFLGGIGTNYNSNFIHGSGKLMVVEADEYDRSFLQLDPKVAIVTTMDSDHLDIYGNGNELEKAFQEFADKVNPQGALIHRSDLRLSASVSKKYSYSISGSADFMISDHSIIKGKYRFNVSGPFGEMKGLDLTLPGDHNMENALAAIAACYHLGISEDEIRSGLSSFKGIKRRFELIFQNEKVTFIDDYAHHPTELKAAISSVRKMYPNKKLTGVFQPHLFSRTRDYMSEFGAALSTLDQLYLMDIYPAREEPIEGITSSALLEKVSTEKVLCGRNDLVNSLAKDDAEVIVTLGAGDIDRLVPSIKTMLESR